MDSVNLLDTAACETGTTVATHKGFPNPAAERGGAPLSLDRLLISHPSSTYFFRVRGHSWHRLGVFDDDIAVVDRSRTPTPGSLVIWWDEAGELLISQWQPTAKREIWGVVIATIHEHRGKR